MVHLLYHNPRCSKSRACIKILSDKKINFKEVLYLKDGLSISSLKDIVNNLVSPSCDLIRTNEKQFKLEPFTLNKKDLIVSFLHKHPICLQRPLFFDGYNYIICRPPEKVLQYLKNK